MVSNFEFLEKDFPVLANFGELAEKYCYSDSNSCLMKLGMIGETIVNLMFTYDRIALPQDNTAVARIDTLVREGLLTRDLATILHGLRKVRNKAVHENYSSVTDSKNFLLMAYGMCEWFMQTYGDWSYTHKDFVMPEENVMIVSVDKEAEEKKEAELAKQAEENAANAPKVARDERKKQANKVANQRPKTEAETRFLIDEQLRMVGWEADTENIRYSKGVRPTKGRKLAIAEYPTNSTVGNRGYADYALFIGEKLVGIIEAKAIHKDIPSVIDYQGKDYPRCIREEDEKYVIGKWGEFKVPFTFATNGRPYLEQYRTKSGIWFLDLRKPDNSPMALHGWMSPDGMEELLAADVDSRNKELKEMPYDLLTDKDGLNLRPYQLNAIKAAEEAVISGKQTALLAMATGTGKTRTVLGMIYRFLKTERFRRILFLVDRTALGEQAQDVFEEVKMEDLLTLDDIYNIKGLEDKTIDKETRIHISTVQGMVKRIMYNNGETMPAVSDYDLLIIDEAHRGYILDKEMCEDEVLYRDQREYQSKYRAVIEYFNAIKIALTATPALQTTEIFGQPVFKYTYREAVIEGYLVDHDAPHELKTKLSSEGIHYKQGETVTIYDPVTGEMKNKPSGGLQPFVSLNFLRTYLVPVPPVEEQQRIVSILADSINKIRNIDVLKNELTASVKKAKSKILDLAIRGKLVPQDPNDEPASVLLERIRVEKEELIKQGKIKRDKKESIIFRGDDNSYYEKIGDDIENIDTEIPFNLPDNWIWCRGCSCFSGMETTKPQGEFFDYIDIDSIDNRLHCIKKTKRIPVIEAPSRASRAINSGSVLFSLVRPYLENIALIEEIHSHSIASTGFYVCNSNGLLLPDYMFYLMISKYVVDGLNQYMKGDNSPSISRNDIENWLYPIPPIDEQRRICYILKTTFATIEKLEESLI